MTETVAAAPVETRDTKLEIIMGREALDKLADATVLVLGCGGVGSNCCEALARGGIGHFVILDKDVIAPSNINRQAIAFHSTIGKRKVDVMEAMIHDINPAATVIKRTEYLLSDNIDDFFASVLEQTDGKLDYVIDAIDTDHVIIITVYLPRDLLQIYLHTLLDTVVLDHSDRHIRHDHYCKNT